MHGASAQIEQVGASKRKKSVRIRLPCTKSEGAKKDLGEGTKAIDG